MRLFGKRKPQAQPQSWLDTVLAEVLRAIREEEWSPRVYDHSAGKLVNEMYCGNITLKKHYPNGKTEPGDMKRVIVFIDGVELLQADCGPIWTFFFDRIAEYTDMIVEEECEQMAKALGLRD